MFDELLSDRYSEIARMIKTKRDLRLVAGGGGQHGRGGRVRADQWRDDYRLTAAPDGILTEHEVRERRR